jgi:hypothetical protein
MRSATHRYEIAGAFILYVLAAMQAGALRQDTSLGAQRLAPRLAVASYKPQGLVFCRSLHGRECKGNHPDILQLRGGSDGPESVLALDSGVGGVDAAGQEGVDESSPEIGVFGSTEAPGEVGADAAVEGLIERVWRCDLRRSARAWFATEVRTPCHDRLRSELTSSFPARDGDIAIYSGRLEWFLAKDV